MIKLKQYFKKCFRSEFVKNAFTVFSGASISQIIPFFISPILTRIFDPSDYALLALFTTTALFFANISTMQYESAIMIPKSDKDALNILALSIIITTALSVFLFVGILFFSKHFVQLMGDDRMRYWVYCIPISVFLQGTFRSFNMFASRMKLFKDVAVRNILQTSSTSGAKVSFGLLGFTNGTLIISTILGQTISTSYLIYQSIRKKEIKIKDVSFFEIKKNAKYYKNFPLFRSPLAFINMFNETSIRYIISNFYNSTVLGLYSFVMGLMQRPTQLIGQAISQVFFQKSAEMLAESKNGWYLLKQTILYLIIAGVIIYTPFILWGDKIFGFIFGEKWIEAGVYAKYLVPWFFIKFVFTPISSIPMIYNKQKEELMARLGFNIVIPAVYLFYGIKSYSINGALIVTSIIAFFYLGAMIYWFRSIVKNNLID